MASDVVRQRCEEWLSACTKQHSWDICEGCLKSLVAIISSVVLAAEAAAIRCAYKEASRHIPTGGQDFVLCGCGWSKKFTSGSTGWMSEWQSHLISIAPESVLAQYEREKGGAG